MVGWSKWDLFTPVMHLLEPMRRPTLRRAVALLHERIPLTRDLSVLDVGCGTGSVLRELQPYGCRLTASEPTSSMRRYVANHFPSVTLYDEPAHAMRSIADHSQDVSLVSATLHGMSPEYRIVVYAELRRVTRRAVVVLDYHANRNPLVAMVEALEGGDYFNFVRVVEAELTREFANHETVRISAEESMYLCSLKG